MPLFHCSKCQHEWEASQETSVCDWCKSEGVIIQKQTEFEIFIENFLKKNPDQMKKIFKELHGDD